MRELSFEQLSALLKTVFAPREGEGWLTIMTDLPDARAADDAAWRDRRAIAAEWFRLLSAHAAEVPFSDVVFCTYPHVGSNNNDLPDRGVVVRSGGELARLPEGEGVELTEVLEQSSVVLLLTQFSATAPLKLLARKHGFRGATLPGFSRAMLPVLGLDYEAVNERVLQFKRRMDAAQGVRITLGCDGRHYESYFDLRHRSGHASGGLIREIGTVGNLPSGEAYIVPYEGERAGDASATAGDLPVQFGAELVVYRIEGNRAVEVLSSGPRSEQERRLLAEEPAYGNMAEVGIGVLGEWGVTAVGSTLLDEKLGLHIAFGRSDHFGGITGVASFRDRERVVHIDRVYVPSIQPSIVVEMVEFEYPDGKRETIIEAGRYTV